ncbi:MAG: hypothetical protein J6K62_02290 [Clostridia bacterium]|nr:hypothetical protein [Clostridia bacterium]
MKRVEWGECYVSSDGAECRQYGICLHLSDGSLLKMDDVATLPEGVVHLAKRLQGEPMDAVQLRYLIEDYVTTAHLIP